MSAVLRAEQVEVVYGGVRALTGVDLEVGAGRLVGLIGPNGAGKTTLIDAVTGFVRASGAVLVDGADVSHEPPHRRARRGLRRTWQAADLFDELTVRENLTVAAGGAPVDDVLALLRIERLAELEPQALTQGQRKLVGVGRALVGEPRVVCLDEPAAGLDTDESAALGGELRQIADRGVGLLLVDHDMGLVLGVCDEVVVLEFGRVIARGAPETVRRDPAVIEAYLGAAGSEVAR